MKPVVTTNKGGIPEVVKHGRKTGFVISVENYRKELFPYISMLLDSQLFRDALSQQGGKRAKEFSGPAQLIIIIRCLNVLLPKLYKQTKCRLPESTIKICFY